MKREKEGYRGILSGTKQNMKIENKISFMSVWFSFGYLMLTLSASSAPFSIYTSFFLNTLSQHNTTQHNNININTMPSLSEAFQDHPVYLHHHKHPDFNSLQQQFPESYAWTQPDSDHHHHYSDNTTTNTVPVIDFKDPNASNLIGHACKTWGVFQLVNHGIPIKLFTDIQTACLALFSLPLHQKLKAARSPDGVAGYGRARISSFFPKLMWSECFTILDSPLHLFLQLWPQDYAKYWYVTGFFLSVKNNQIK